MQFKRLRFQIIVLIVLEKLHDLYSILLLNQTLLRIRLHTNDDFVGKLIEFKSSCGIIEIDIVTIVVYQSYTSVIVPSKLTRIFIHHIFLSFILPLP